MVNKIPYIEEQTFRSVRESGYAEEEVDEYKKAVVLSYNKAIDHIFEVETANEELQSEKENLQVELQTVTNELEQSNLFNNELQRRIGIANDEITGLRHTRDNQIEELRTLSHQINEVRTEAERIETEKYAVIKERDNLLFRVQTLETELANKEISTIEAPSEQVTETTPAVFTEETEETETTSNSYYGTEVEYRQNVVNTLVKDENRVQLPTVDEAKEYFSTIAIPVEPSDRASYLLSKAYSLGEEYVETAHRERAEILDEANTIAEEIVTTAGTKAATIVDEAETDKTNIIREARAEAEHVANSVAILRKERDETLSRLRDFHYTTIERIEIIAELPEFDPEILAEADTPTVEVNEALEEAERSYNIDEAENNVTVEEIHVETEPVTEITETHPHPTYNTSYGYEENNYPAPVVEETTQEVTENVITTPVVEQENVYEPVQETETVTEWHQPTEAIEIVETEWVQQEEEPVVEETYDTFEPAPQTGSHQYASFTEIIEQPEETPVVEETEEEPKKKSFLHSLRKQRKDN